MAFRYEFDATNRVLRARLYGMVSDATLDELYVRTPEYLQRAAPRALIFDCSEITSLRVSPSTIQVFAATDAVIKDPGFIRIIVAPAQHIFGMSRMFQLFSEPTRPGTAVVHALEEVLGILGVQELHFEPMEPEVPAERRE